MASLKIVPSHFHQGDVCVRLMSCSVFWPGLSVCRGCFMRLSRCCNYTEEFQFTFLECHFITFISVPLSLPGPVQDLCISNLTSLHESHQLKCYDSFLFLCVCVSCVCQIIIHLLRSLSYWQRMSAGVLLQGNTWTNKVFIIYFLEENQQEWPHNKSSDKTVEEKKYGRVQRRCSGSSYGGCSARLKKKLKLSASRAARS